MTQPIDVAYVEVVAPVKHLKKLESDIDKTMDRVEKNIQRDLDDIDKSFSDVFDSIDAHFKKTERDADRSFKSIRNFADRAFDSMKRRFIEPLSDGMKTLAGLASETGRVIGQIGSGIGSFVSSSPLLVLILALAPAIIALAAALSQLIGLVGVIPSGFAVLLSAIIPVVVAFQNFGDAVSALASGDIDKINEALAKLSPSAGAVAKEIAAMLPNLRAFQRLVQEGFFAPLVGDFTNLTRTLLPTLEKGFFEIARSMGILTSSFAELFAHPDSIQVFRETFASTARIITELTGPLRRFTDMLLSTIHQSLPFVERMAAAFGRALDAFSAFVNKSIETGDFDQFIEDAITTVKELIDLIKAVGGLISTIFGGTEDAGHDFIKTLTDLTIKLDDFLKTAEGKAALDALVLSVKFLAATLETALAIFVFSWISLQRTFGLFETIGRAVVGFVQLVIEWIGKIPGAVTEFIGSLPGKVAAFFKNMFDMALMAIGIGIGMILFAIQVLPGKILDFLMSLPQRIYNIMITIGPLIALALQGAVDFGRNIIVNGFNAIVDFVLSVPERLKALIPTFGSAGSSLIQSFMNGFRSVGSFIGDIAGDIVGAVKGFLNKAIDRINSGIATIDNILPGDLGRIPRLAQGALVRHRPGGILANIGEGDEDEVVAPLSKLEGMFQGGSNVNFGPGSINVNFSGAVPTEEQARQTGEAIGAGVLARIQQRNLQTQVRAI